MSNLAQAEKRLIKCVVWDLDGTLWSGVLLEGDEVKLRSGILDVVRTLDQRGILQSLASRNHPEPVMAKLQEFAIADYFLFPQINWGPKSASIRRIAKSLNISLDALAFVDDDPFEREEVRSSCSDVLCLDAAACGGIVAMPEMDPGVISQDSRRRRAMFLDDLERQRAEAEFEGPQESFLATLDMVLTVAPAEQQDLDRARELTLRTHQLNSTGRVYTHSQLRDLVYSKDHKLLVTQLQDRFGSYGQVGFTLLECSQEVWTIKLFLISCRVMSRGVGSALLNLLIGRASHQSVTLQAEFRHNGRNQPLYRTYRLLGFKEVDSQTGTPLLVYSGPPEPPLPQYLKLHAEALS